MLLCKFGQNPSIGLQDIALERLISTIYGLVTLKIRSRSPNSEPPPNNALVQVWSKSIHLFRRYRVGKPNLISFHWLVTLKMRSRSPKSNQLFPPLPTMYLCKFGQNPSTGSKDIASERSYADVYANADVDAVGIRTKNNKSPILFGGHNSLIYDIAPCFLKYIV